MSGDPFGIAALLIAYGSFGYLLDGTLQLTLTVTEGTVPVQNLNTCAGFQPFGIEPMAFLTPGGDKATVHI